MKNQSAFLYNPVDEKYQILQLAAVFESNFSIDWLQELTNLKASQILTAMEHGLVEFNLTRVNSSVFCFSDQNQKRDLLNTLSPDEIEHLHQQAIKILLNQLPEEDSKSKALAFHYQHITNDVEGCRWISRAANEFLREYRIEDALRLYAKCIEDIDKLSGEEAYKLFAEVAIKYSKISIQLDLYENIK